MSSAFSSGGLLQCGVAMAALSDATKLQTAAAVAVIQDVSSISPDVTGALAQLGGDMVSAVSQTIGTSLNLLA